MPRALSAERLQASAKSFTPARIFLFGAVSALNAGGLKRGKALGQREILYASADIVVWGGFRA